MNIVEFKFRQGVATKDGRYFLAHGYTIINSEWYVVCGLAETKININDLKDHSKEYILSLINKDNDSYEEIYYKK